ncbi:hypothetical protein PILCRDRAFT_14678 [Piloderma croceum F 1598]|uniref:DUF6533 domain-containing protein n=1 Tax=Piloderma croceum (strain F 1598) TaxID=765440 RepID=A0A0C3ENI4_PILCF|nr:hypothetical protein PILCRDRAFT_14678 [Piloderma croceum F 1598]
MSPRGRSQEAKESKGEADQLTIANDRKNARSDDTIDTADRPNAGIDVSSHSVFSTVHPVNDTQTTLASFTSGATNEGLSMVSSDDKATQKQLTINYYVSLVSFVILYYDHALTLPMEIQRFWIRGFTWATLFFFINRYLAFLGHIPVIMEVFWNFWQTCRLLQSYHQYLVVAIQLLVGVAVLLIMRVYAMYDRKKWVIWLFVIIASADIGVGCWGIISNEPTAVSPFARAAQGCSEPLGSEQGIHLAIAWSGQLFFDAICFLLTLRKSFSIGRMGQRTLIDTLLRDGAVYFAIMTAANLGNILTFLLAAPLSKGVASTFVNMYTAPSLAQTRSTDPWSRRISVTMMSRLMLNLRDPKILILTSRRTTEASTAVPNHMVTTYLDPMDPNLLPTTEEREEEVTSPIEDIEMVPRAQSSEKQV